MEASELPRNLRAGESIVYALHCQLIRSEVHKHAPEGGHKVPTQHITHNRPLSGFAVSTLAGRTSGLAVSTLTGTTSRFAVSTLTGTTSGFAVSTHAALAIPEK